MRCFLAWEYDVKSVENIFNKVFDELVKHNISFTPVSLSLSHITTIFFGNISDSIVDRVDSVLSEYFSNKVKNKEYEFENVNRIISHELSHFNSRVIFMNILQQEELNEIRKRIIDVLCSDLFLRDKLTRLCGEVHNEFHAHITIARVKFTRGASLPKILHKLSNSLDFPITIDLGKLCLYQSVLTRYGPKYTKLNCYDLN